MSNKEKEEEVEEQESKKGRDCSRKIVSIPVVSEMGMKGLLASLDDRDFHKSVVDKPLREEGSSPCLGSGRKSSASEHQIS